MIVVLLRANPAVADVLIEDREINSRKIWRQAQALANFFWRRFISKYIPNQIKRKKWTEETRSMKVGDLVLVADSKQPRGSWPMEILLEIHPGADNVVRVVTIKTPSGTYKRSVTKVCLVEVVDQDDGHLSSTSTGGGDVPTSGD